jgi:glyoxylase-like metal-dependent hydrolase (beta-lactamase superfamily II)
VLGAVIAALAAVGVHAQGAPVYPYAASSNAVPFEAPPGTNFAKIEFKTEKLAPHFYTLTGSAGADPVHPEAAGGRIGFLEGPDGIVMVDSSYAPVGAKVLAALRSISPGRVRFLINTHSHLDHVGGNAAFARMGAVVIARQETRDAVLQPPPGVSRDPARAPGMTVGLGQPARIYLDGETIDLIALPAAHTNGDLMVRFEGADLIMLGDAYRSYGYPFIDRPSGGTVKGMLEALDLMLQMAGPRTMLVPGHGPVVQREQVAEQRDMILAMQTRVRVLIAEGQSRAEILAAKPTASFDPHVLGALDLAPGGGTGADRFVGSIYDELSKPKQP